MPRARPRPSAVPGAVPAAGELARALEAVLAERVPARIAAPGRRAAVLLVLYDRVGAAHLLLTKRAESMPSHPGQVSLPGGVVEDDDPSPRHAALREAEEEVGIPPAAVRVLGELDDVPTMASGFIIRPVVAAMSAPLRPRPSEAEVARVLEVPVATLLEADAALPVDPAPLALRYPLAEEDVWGATARILRTFCRVTRQALSRRDEGAPGMREGADPGA